MTSPKEMDVVILCGGEGRRLSAVVKDRPKPMAQIGEHVFMDLLLNYFNSFGFRRFILCVCHMSNFIKEHYKNKRLSFEVEISQEDSPLGTAGAIKNAQRFIKSNPFLVTNGDSVCRMDYSEFIRSYYENKALYSIALYKTNALSDYGRVTLDNHNWITNFQEKAGPASVSNLISTGVYILDRKIFSAIPEGVKCSIEYEVFPELAGKGLLGFKDVEDFIDIGTPERLEKARLVLEKMIK